MRIGGGIRLLLTPPRAAVEGLGVVVLGLLETEASPLSAVFYVLKLCSPAA